MSAPPNAPASQVFLEGLPAPQSPISTVAASSAAALLALAYRRLALVVLLAMNCRKGIS